MPFNDPSDYGFSQQKAVQGLEEYPLAANAIVTAAADTVVPFGAVLKEGTTEGSTALATANSDEVKGIALRDHLVETQDGTLSTASTVPAYPAGHAIRILRQGRVWVKVSGAVGVGNNAFLDISEGSEKLTIVSTDNLRVGKFVTAAAADGDLALVEIDVVNL